MSTPPNEQTANAPLNKSLTASALEAVRERDIARVVEGLNLCPGSGEGVHNWLFHVACRLKEAGLTLKQAEALESEIEELMARAPNPPNEILSAIRAAYGERKSSTPRWCPPNPIEIARVEKDGPTLLELKNDLSPERVELRFKDGRAANYVDTLFPERPLLCIGKSEKRFMTAPRDEWPDHILGVRSLIVPSPMIAIKGRRKSDEQMSYHTEDNTGPRRYLGVEYDSGSLDSMAARLWHLNSYRQLVMVVYSGGKSLHGWFDFRNEPEERVEKFFNLAVKIGADPKTFSRSQFVRMPCGARMDFNRDAVLNRLEQAGIHGLNPGHQAVMYWNPKAIRQ